MLDTESRPVRRKLLGAPCRGDDATLVRRAQSGDERAFAAIFERHHPPLLSYCRHMLGNRDDGEDALQQAFIKAHRALLGGTTPRDLRPWLYAIARNCCLSAIAARRPTAPLEDRTPALAGLSEEVRRREDLRELLDGIGRLPEDQRSALLLAELDDLSHQAIATVLGCPVSKVKALVYQARSALIADRDARETPCQEIREQLAVARGGELRRGPLRRHLNLCSGCRDFQLAVGAQRHSLATLLPVAPSAGLMAAILGHGSAHAAGVAGIGGGGAGAGATSAGGAAGTGVGVTSAGASVTGASGIAASGTAAVGTAAGAGTATGAGTSVGALVGGGLVTKLAVGGAVVALAAAGTVATRQRPSPARTSRLAGARIAAFAAGRSGVAGRGAPSDASHGSAATIAAPDNGLPGAQAQGSTTALSDPSGPGALATVDPFTAPTSGAGAPGLLTVTGTGPSNAALPTVPRQLKSGRGVAGADSVAQTRNAQAMRLRAKLRREALRRRALRLREARRRALLRKQRRKALRRRHPLAPKPLKAPEPTPSPVTPAPVRTRHRHPLPSATSVGTSGTSVGSEGKETTTRKRRPPATSTSSGSATDAGTDPQTGATGTGSAKGKTGYSGGEKAASTDAAGKSGGATGAEKSGSTSAKEKTGAGAGPEKSGSTAGNEETGTGGHTGSPQDGGQTGDLESGTPSGAQPEGHSQAGAAGTGKTADSSEQGNTATHKNQASGAGATSGKGGASSPKKHLLEEEQLPNL
jgi:RNA polymerase sigma factor (sigma-70 family)